MSTFAQYVAVLMLHLSKKKENEAMAGSFKGLARNLSVTLSNNITDKDVADALGVLMSFAGAKFFDSPLTGGYWKVDYDNFRYYFIETTADWEDDAEAYNDTRTECVKKYPILVTYAETGDDFAKDILEHIQNTPEADWTHLRDDNLNENLEGISVPASDRVVTLSHNEAGNLEQATSEVIDLVEAELGIDGDPSLKSRILGQLKAGRELIREKTFSALIMYNTLLAALAFLIQKYAGQAIAETARALYQMLIELVFSGN